MFGSGPAADKRHKPFPPYANEHFARFREMYPSKSYLDKSRFGGLQSSLVYPQLQTPIVMEFILVVNQLKLFSFKEGIPNDA